MEYKIICKGYVTQLYIKYGNECYNGKSYGADIDIFLLSPDVYNEYNTKKHYYKTSMKHEYKQII